MATRRSIARSKALLVILAAAGAGALLTGIPRRSIRAVPAQDAAGDVTAPADDRPADPEAPPRLILAADDQPAAEETTPQDATADTDAGPSTELQLLRDRVAALEQQPAQTQTDSSTEVLQDLNDQVARAKRQLARQQALREARSADAEERRAERDQAIDALLDVQDRLAVGDSEVVDVLERVSPALPLPAQRAVKTARAEIEQEELYTARYWISVAVAEAERTELGR